MVKKFVSTRGGFSFTDMFMIGLSKTVSEQFLSGIVGNANLLSGGVKVAGALILPTVIKGKVGNIIGTGLAVDGVEDLVQVILSGFGGGLNLGGGSGIEVI